MEPNENKETPNEHNVRIEELKNLLKIANDQIQNLNMRMKALEERLRIFEEYGDKY